MFGLVPQKINGKWRADMNGPSNTSRRSFLKLTGSSLVLIPLVNLYGCGEEQPERLTEPPETTGQAPAAQAPSAQQPPAQETSPGAQAQGAAGGAMERLEESNPQAQALGYKHSATDVDKSAYPRYEQGQLCSNCNLFVAEQGDEQWGGCQIFPGKLVNADGWCSAWVPAA